jgi:hypothetical protein
MVFQSDAKMWELDESKRPKRRMWKSIEETNPLKQSFPSVV